MKKYIFGLIGFIILLVVDRFTKLAALSIKGTDGIPVIKGVFRFLYLENHGAAFGVLQNQRFFLLCITAIILIAVIAAYIKVPFTKKYFPISMLLILIVSGATGNMIDRIIYGYVIDFLYFELIDFPIFNVADCYIVIAAVLGAILIMFYYNDEDLEIFKLKSRKGEN